jgi:hypothetical protein
MAGYSGTALPQKLGIKEGARVGVVRAPADFGRTMGVLPFGVVPRAVSAASGVMDVIVCFVRTRKELGEVKGLKKKLGPAGGLWVAWPKKASGLAAEVGEGEVREAGLGAGLVDNKVCAIDETWSGLRFVVRAAERPGARR